MTGMWDLSKLAIFMSLLLLAALFWWLPAALMTPAIHLTGLYRNVPDYYIEHFKVTEMNAEGRPKYVLRAARMVHYPHARSTKLIRPRLTQFNASGVTRSRAQTGWMSRNGKRLLMLGNVRVTRSKSPNSVSANIATQRINIILR
ncbi:MAG: LPS export ABC transporter periplasmic protein LptC [Acidiferrobacteraceae bacterium]|jgi:LPS export ABC transporter protein LptC